MKIDKKEGKAMETATIELTVPKELAAFWKEADEDLRNAMLIYPAVWNGMITYGKAAEIIGMPKLELMDLYEQFGIPYIYLTREDLHAEIESIKTSRDDAAVLSRTREA